MRTLGTRLAAVTAAVALAGNVLMGTSTPADASTGAHVFGASGLGGIDDAPAGGDCPHPTGGSPRDVHFDVAGLPARPLSDVRVEDLRITHDLAGDVSAT